MRVLAATLPGDGSCIDAASTVADRRGGLASAVACAGVSALVLVAPFERRQPLVEFSWQSITTVEAALAAMLATWLLASAWSRERPRWRTPLTAPWAALVGAAFLAALVAPDHRGNALNMTGRFGLAFAVYLVTVAGATTAARVRRVTVAAVVSGAVAALLAVLEYLGWPAVVEALAPFRAGVAHVGAQVRAGGPFQYPTIASMYLEIAFALALGLLTLAIDGRRHRLAALVFITLLLLAEAVTLTLHARRPADDGVEPRDRRRDSGFAGTALIEWSARSRSSAFWSRCSSRRRDRARRSVCG